MSKLNLKQLCTNITLLCCSLGIINSAAAYERIVSTTGNASQIIAQLGQADKLVAVDTTSNKPKDVMQQKPKIGYRRALSAESILSMNPDLIILAPDAGPPAVIKQLEASNVKTLTIKDKKSLAGVIDDINLIAKELNAGQQAKEMTHKIRRDEGALRKIINSYQHQPKMAFLMRESMAFGADTAGDGMIDIVGGQNIFAKQFKSVKPISLELLSVSDADMLIFAILRKTDELPAKLTPVDKPLLKNSKAGKNHCIFTIDISDALGFGPDLTEAAKEIAQAAKQCVAH